jgi:hypothetical protein
VNAKLRWPPKRHGAALAAHHDIPTIYESNASSRCDLPIIQLTGRSAGCDRQRDHEELPGGICTDSNWPFANAVSLDRNSDLQCFTESCPLDCDCVIWRFRSTRLSLVMVAPIFGGVVGGIIGRWLRQE